MEGDDRVPQCLELSCGHLDAWGGETKHGHADAPSRGNDILPEPGSERHANDGNSSVTQDRVKQRVHACYIHDGVHHRHVCLADVVTRVSWRHGGHQELWKTDGKGVTECCGADTGIARTTCTDDACDGSLGREAGRVIVRARVMVSSAVSREHVFGMSSDSGLTTCEWLMSMWSWSGGS